MFEADARVNEALAMLGSDGDLRGWTDAHTRSLSNLVAEGYSLRKDAERLNWIEHQHLEELSLQLVVDAEHDGEYYVCGDSNKPGYGLTLRAAIDAAMAAG